MFCRKKGLAKNRKSDKIKKIPENSNVRRICYGRGKTKDKRENRASDLCSFDYTSRPSDSGNERCDFISHKEIEVGGLEYASDTEVIEWVKQDEMSANTLYLLWKYRMQKPELLPFIDEIKVTLKSPWSVKINVTEKKIVGYIAAEEGYYYFDKEGLVVFQNEVPLEAVPCIEGMEVEEKKLYHQLKTADNKVFAHILDVTQLLKKEELKPDRILSDGKNVTLYFSAICVELGSEGYANKIVQLPAVLEKLEGQTGVLQMKYYNADSKYISFRRTDPEAEAAKAEAEAAAEAARQEAENQEEGAGETQEKTQKKRA